MRYLHVTTVGISILIGEANIEVDYERTYTELDAILHVARQRWNKVSKIVVIIINNCICLRHISSNKTIQRRITLYRNIQITLK